MQDLSIDQALSLLRLTEPAPEPVTEVRRRVVEPAPDPSRALRERIAELEAEGTTLRADYTAALASFADVLTVCSEYASEDLARRKQSNEATDETEATIGLAEALRMKVDAKLRELRRAAHGPRASGG